jgi:asparagine synthase (glutamine-hydrolysing)
LVPAIASFLLSLPEEFLIDESGASKRVFRDAMRGLVPDVILDRTDKVGFATPERTWLLALGPWVDSVLSSGALAAVPALHAGTVRRQWREIAAGRRRFDARVWRWCNLIVWSQKMKVNYA